jgi:hypothetical protein
MLDLWNRVNFSFRLIVNEDCKFFFSFFEVICVLGFRFEA